MDRECRNKEIKLFFFLLIAMAGWVLLFQTKTDSSYSESPELPSGYVHCGDSKWISDTEWTGEVIDARGVLEISKECKLYKMTIYGSFDKKYTVLPLYDWNGEPSVIFYDGNAFE